jgi:hypothetical protein
MKKSTALLSTIASFALAISATAASATDFLFTFSGDSAVNGASGMLSATANGDGTYTATSGTISAFGDVASGTGALIANPNGTAVSNSPSGYFNYDNQLFPDSTVKLTNAGLLFNIGGSEVNIFSDASYVIYKNNGANVTGNFSLSEVAAVPEAATWTMMILGFGMIGAGSRYRRNSTKVAYA